MQKTPPLEHGKYYHIYNRGNNRVNLFKSDENYLYFLKLYYKYIELIADTYAYCLMPNHFHLLVRIKEESEIGYLLPINGSIEEISHTPDASRSADSGRSCHTVGLPESNGPGRAGFKIEELGRTGTSPKWKTTQTQGFENLKKPCPSKMFSHLFNAYATYFNKKEERTGSLFEKNFHRIPINSDKYFRNLVYYIHNNPVHHGLMNNLADYHWSSFGVLISEQATKLKKNEVMDWFDGLDNFIAFHRLNNDLENISSCIIE